MHHHSKSISGSEASYINSRSYALSEHPHVRSPSFFNNIPSCHLEDYIQTEHSFRPEIHQLPLDLYPNRQKVEISRDERFERLLDNKLERQQQLYQAKIQNQQVEVQKHCTFQPNAEREVEFDGEVFDRLYQQGLEKQREKEKVTPQISNECTFQPKMNKANILNSEKVNLQPIYLRFKEQIKKKLERNAELKKRAEVENEQKLTQFVVNQESEKILQQKQNFNKNVVERLLSYMKQADYKNKMRIQEKNCRMNQELTFTPEINPLTIDLPGDDFFERQQILAQESRQKIANKQNQMIKSQCPFRPKVSIISDYLISIKRADEAKEDKIERMFYQYPQIKQGNLQKIQEQHYRQCTFHPQINPISRQLDANHIHHCCGRPHQKQYSHKPKLNQKSLKMAATKRTNSVALQTKADKIKMELEYKQMKECTFKPKTLPGMIKSQTNVTKINGFQNFMRSKQLKLKQEQQQKVVQQKLFRMEKRYDMRVQKQTKVDAFKLSKTNRDINNVLEQDLKRFQENCPFRPNVNRQRRCGQRGSQ